MTDKKENTKPDMRQVTTKVRADIADKLEGYAYGTRRRMSQIARDALEEYAENHAEEIKKRAV